MNVKLMYYVAEESNMCSHIEHMFNNGVTVCYISVWTYDLT